MIVRIAGIVPALLFLCGMLVGCGGGSDVGNPCVPVTGTVTMRLSSGEKAPGARVVLARRGADPGFSSETYPVPEDDISLMVRAIYFDTTYADINGNFSFDSIHPGAYTLVASYHNLVALETFEHSTGMEDPIAMVVDDPATVTLRNYTEIDLEEDHFIAARIVGTEYVDSADTNGEITLHDVPSGTLNLVLYRTSLKREHFYGLKAEPGCEAELYTLPDLPAERWTPHPCGWREPLGLPYVLENIINSDQAPDTNLAYNRVIRDMQIQFSHGMDAFSTGKAVHGYSDGDSVVIDTLWWEGGNLLNVRLCTVDSSGNCRTGEDRFLQGVTYGVTIDTTAQTDLGVHFAYEAYIRFVPFP
jgi:hypothetical protein